MNKCIAFNRRYSYLSEDEEHYEMVPSYSNNEYSISVVHFKAQLKNECLFNVPINTYPLMKFENGKRTVLNGVKILKELAVRETKPYCAPGFFESFFNFISIVLAEENLFAFEKIMSDCGKNNGISLSHTIFNKQSDSFYLVLNLIQLDGNALEKLYKSFGEVFMSKNLTSDEIVFDNESSKLNQALGIPKEIMKRIGQDFQHSLSHFKTICDVGNGNDAVYLINFIDSVYGESVGNKKETLVRDIAKIMEKRKTSMPTLLTYLFRQQYYNTFVSKRSFFAIDGICNAATTLVDSIIMHEKIMKCKMESLPTDLYYEHMVLVDNFKAMESNPESDAQFIDAVNKYSRLNYEADGFIMKAPENAQELIIEGTVLRHCVASYKDRIANNGCIVMFCRKKDAPDVPFVTIEFEYDLGITQIKTFCDKDVLDEDVLQFAHKWEEEVNTREKVQCA